MHKDPLIMRRRALLGVVAIITLLFLTTGTALALLVRHIPAYYQRTGSSAIEERDCHCREFFARTSGLLMMGEQNWDREFTQEQFNSYFQSQDEESELSARLVEIPPEDQRCPCRIRRGHHPRRVPLRRGLEKLHHFG